MGQKTNPNIFQLGKTNNWQSKCFEKKITEYSVYSKKDLEIRSFIQKFFKDHERIIHYCKLCYLEKSLHIFISYHLNLNASSFTYGSIPLIFIDKKEKRTKKELKQKKIFSQLLNIKPRFLNKQIKHFIQKIDYNKKKERKTKIRTIDFLNKKKVNIKFQDNFIEKLADSLTNFTLKKFKLVLHLKALNINIMSKIRTKKFLKKKLVNLRKFRETEFFLEGINILFTCATNKKSSKLLAQFLAIQLKGLKRHNFFLNFIKDTLLLFRKSVLSKFKGIKIKIKGRLNGRPRARSRVLKIANDVSLLTIDSIIDYSESTAFTANGTLGVKVWIHEFSD